MADRQSLGPVQIITNSVIELNRALQELVDRIDTQKGLRGPVVVHDRVQVADPVDATDALNRQSLVQLEDTVTGLKTFDRDPAAPFAVTAGSAKVDNLDADLLDGLDGTQYVHIGGPETITGVKTIEGVEMRWVDLNGQLIHAFGTKI